MPGVSRDELKASIRKLTTELQARDSSLREVSRENVGLKAKVSGLHTTIARLESDATTRESELRTAEASLRNEGQNFTEMQKVQEKVHEHLAATLRQRHRLAEGTLQHTIATLQQAQGQLEAKVHEQQQQLAAGQQQQQQLTATVQKQQQQLLVALQQLVDAQRQLLDVRTAPQQDLGRLWSPLELDRSARQEQPLRSTQRERSRSASDDAVPVAPLAVSLTPGAGSDEPVDEDGAGELATAAGDAALLKLADDEVRGQAKLTASVRFAKEESPSDSEVSKDAKATTRASTEEESDDDEE